MQENDPQNAAFYWSTLFVRSLFEEGIRHVVISPGSRSTALTLAFAVHPGFKTHVVIDERSAAFTALGIAKASGVPAVLVCTSGTAVANYFPAVIEATQSGVPMIVASADRPPHARGLGTSQTIDQLKIFGDYSVFFHEAGEALAGENSQKRLQIAATQAVHFAVSKGGVSHLNFPFSKPFEPASDFLIEVENENRKHAKTSFPKYVFELGEMEMGETFWSDLISAEHPLIVIGPTTNSHNLTFINKLAKALKAPILAEPGSNIPKSKYTIQGFDGFLRNSENREKLTSDLILRFGAQPVSKALNEYLEEHKESAQISFMSDIHWNDGSLSSTKQIILKAPLSIPDVTGSADRSWLKTWEKTEKAYKKHRDSTIAPTSPITDGYVFFKISEVLPAKSFCMLSNSFPVRDMSLFGAFQNKEIHVNRGAAGIDGITSTAIGLSLSSQKPGVLFTGDIAFLHDSNALLTAKLIDQPLVIIILNNGGGTIFRMLPVHSIKDKFTPFFETPQSVNIAALCRAHKVDHTVISRPEQFVQTFENLISQKGLHILECVTDADASMEQRNQLWDFIAANKTSNH